MKKKGRRQDDSSETQSQSLPPVLSKGHQKAVSMFNPTREGTNATLELASLAGGKLNLDLLKNAEYNRKQMQLRQVKQMALRQEKIAQDPYLMRENEQVPSTR